MLLSGYLWLGALVWDNPQKYCGAWNLGADDSSHITVAEVVDIVIQYWGEGAWEDLSDQDAAHEAKLLKLSCDKAHAELKWYSVLGIDECLQKTAGCYKMFYGWKAPESMYEYCAKQIAEYVERAKKRNLLWTEK